MAFAALKAVQREWIPANALELNQITTFSLSLTLSIAIN